MTRTTRRGYQPNDHLSFSGANLERLNKGHRDLVFLLDHGYAMKPALTLVGNHYQFSLRQRTALMRSSISGRDCLARRQRRIDLRDISPSPILIDGFNQIITLETALSGSLLLVGDDQVIRDLAALRGSYRIIDKTEPAVNMMLQTLVQTAASQIIFLLDRPVSNSGRLRQLILKQAEFCKTPVDVLLLNNPDAELAGRRQVVSSDRVVLDRCSSWINLGLDLTIKQIPDAWIIRFRY